MGAVVFIGPTLGRRDAIGYLDCVYLPPARQGDIYRAVRDHRPTVIGLVDGKFLDVPSVWHRELLWALAEGVHLFGAASMGALRAVELEPFGMRGVGTVYEAYRSGRWRGFDEPFEDDDEVAVIHAPSEVGGGALSDAMVDLRETLLAAEASAILGKDERYRLAAAMKELHFPDRSFDRLSILAHEILSNEAAEDFCKWLSTNHVFRKRSDAIELLQEIASLLRTKPGPFVASFRFEPALVWQAFIARESSPDTIGERVLAELHLDPHAWRRVVKAAVCRRETIRSIAVLREEPPDRQELDWFRRARQLWLSSDLEAWRVGNNLSSREFDRLIREEALLMAQGTEGVAWLRSVMIDHLRLTGEYSHLFDRVQAKMLRLNGRIDAHLSPNATTIEIALEWYFERRSLPLPRAIADFVIEAGWPNDAEFKQAVWEDYLFEMSQ